MRIGIAAIGSTGDIQPYLALGRGLLAAGHDVRFLTARVWQQKVEQAGVPYSDSGAAFDAQDLERISRRLVSEPRPFQQLEQIFRDLIPGHVKGLPVMKAKTAELDVLVAHAVDFGAIAAARATGVPLVLSHLFPAFIPARDFHPGGGSLGRVGNALIWRLARAMCRRHTDAILGELFRAAGLPESKDLLLSLNDWASGVLVAISPQIQPRDSSWPATLQITGYWFLEEPSWSPPPELVSFLEAGPPPVVVSFGSMVPIDSATASRAVLDAVAEVGCRAVVQAGWGQLGRAGGASLNVFPAEYVPHGWLLPRAAALVHHGGAGTTAAAFRAGIPQVVVWHAGDQLAWAQRAEKLGVAVKPLSHRKLTARSLSQRLRSLLGDAQLKPRAQELATRIRAEDGVGKAVALIEQVGAEARSRVSANRRAGLA